MENREKESRSSIFSNMRHDYKKAKDAKTIIDKLITEWNEIYYAETEKQSGNKKSKMVMRELAKFIEFQKPNVTEPFIATEKPIKVTSTDSTLSRVASKYLNQEFTKNFDRHKFVEDLVDVLSREGTVWVRSSWDSKEVKTKEKLNNIPIEATAEITDTITSLEDNGDGTVNIEIEKSKLVKNNPYAEVCRNEHIFPDPVARTEAEMQFLCYRKSMTISELYETGLYDDSKLDMLKTRVASKVDDTSLGDYRDSTARDYGLDRDYVPKDTARIKVDIIEYWGFYDVNGDGIAEPVLATWVDKFDVNLRLEDNPFPQKNIPFHRQVYSSRPYSLWGNSLAYFIGDLQKIKSGLVRGILDNMSLSNNGQKFVAKGALDYVNHKRMMAGERYITVNKPDSIQDGSYNQLPQSVFQTLQMVDKEGQELSGLNQRSPSLNSANIDKADGDFVQNTPAQQRMADTVRRVGSLLSKVFKDWIVLGNMFMTNEQIESLYTETEMKYLNILDSDNFSIGVSTGTQTNKQEQIKQLNLLLQQSKTLGESAPPELYNAMVADMFDLFDKPDLATQLREYQPQPSPEQQQMQQMQMQEQQLKNQLLMAQIEESQSKTHKNIGNTQASFMNEETKQFVAQTKASESANKAEATQVDSRIKQAEAINNLTKDNNGNDR